MFMVLSRNDKRGGEFGIFFLGGEAGGVVTDDASDGSGLGEGDVYGLTLNCCRGLVVPTTSKHVHA